MLALFVEAPFAVFRTFTAGWYRPTATFLTPSAAYGLILNLAGIESRLRERDAGHDGKTPATLTKAGLPPVELAVGVPEYGIRRHRLIPCEADSLFPRVQTIFQQLHNYPVGTSGAERAELAKGNKYNITPVRREYLSGLRAVIALRGNDELADRVRRGLVGEFNSARYGVPFLGDNAFLPDRLEILDQVGPVRWFERITAGASDGVRERTARLTLVIDRADLSRTTSALFAPQSHPSDDPPPLAWNLINPPGNDAPTEPAGRPKRKKKT